MHTHFGSATFGASAFLSIALFGTAWRLTALHLMKNRRSQFFRGLGRGMMFQY